MKSEPHTQGKSHRKVTNKTQGSVSFRKRCNTMSNVWGSKRCKQLYVWEPRASARQKRHIARPRRNETQRQVSRNVDGGASAANHAQHLRLSAVVPCLPNAMEAGSVHVRRAPMGANFTPCANSGA